MRVSEPDTWMPRAVTLIAVIVLSPPLFAQTSGPPARTPQDITGTWQQVEEKTMFRWTALDEEPPLQPWALETYKKAREGKRPDERGEGWLDPETYCLPWGTPRLWTTTTRDTPPGGDRPQDRAADGGGPLSLVRLREP